MLSPLSLLPKLEELSKAYHVVVHVPDYGAWWWSASATCQYCFLPHAKLMFSLSPSLTLNTAFLSYTTVCQDCRVPLALDNIDYFCCGNSPYSHGYSIVSKCRTALFALHV